MRKSELKKQSETNKNGGESPPFRHCYHQRTDRLSDESYNSIA